MRRGLVTVALCLMACAHKPPPPPPAPPPPPPPPKGDHLRFKAKAGETSTSKVRLTIESESVAAQGGQRGADKPIVLQFRFGEEEKVDSVAADGSALVSARLVDAVGEASQGANQKVVDDMALAFDELKIQFKRTPRGEISAIGLSGLRAPLQEPTARQVLDAIYGAQRGALFPADPVDVGGTWKTVVPMLASTGFSGAVDYDYTYARKEGTVAGISAVGRLEAKRVGQRGQVVSHLTGQSTCDYRFDVAAGKLVASTIDQMTQVEGAIAGQQTLNLGVRQHIRVEFTVDAKTDQEQP